MLVLFPGPIGNFSTSGAPLRAFGAGVGVEAWATTRVEAAAAGSLLIDRS